MNRRTVPLLLATLLLLTPLSACSASQGVAGDSSGASTREVGPQPAENDAAAGETSTDVDGAQRSVIRTGDISIEVSDPEQSADEVTELANGLGGSVESLTLRGSSGDSPAGAELVMRVPEDRLDEAFDALEGVGSVLSQNRSAVDVTTEHVDLQARVDALAESVDRLTELMAGAASTGELLEAEAALSERQQELDGLRAQLESLEGQISEATVSVTLRTKSALPGGGPENFWEGLLAGVDSISVAGAGALVVLGVLLPWLVIGGVVAIAVVLVVRAARRRKRAGKAAPAESSQTSSTPPSSAS